MIKISNRDKKIYLLIFGYCLAFLFLTLYKYFTFNSDWALDLATDNQITWNLANGNPFGQTMLGDLERHKWMILYFLAPIYRIWPHAQTLIIIKTLLFSLAAIPIYLLAKDTLKSKYLHLLCVLIYLFNGGVIRVLLNDFFAISLSLPLLIFSFYFYFKKRFIWFTSFAILTLTCREELLIFIPIFTIYGLFNYKKFKFFSLLPLLVSVGYFSLFMLNMPMKNFFTTSPNKFILLTLDQQLLSRLLDKNFLWILLEFSLPFNIIILFSYTLGITTIILLIKFITFLFSYIHLNYEAGSFQRIITHLFSPFVSLIVLSNILALKRIASFTKNFNLGTKPKKIIKIFLIIMILSTGLLLTKKHFLIEGNRSIHSTLEIWKLIELIPPTASVVTDESLIAALSSRQKVFYCSQMSSSVNEKDIDYVLYVANDEALENSQLNVNNFNVVAENEFCVLLKNKR